MSIYFGNKKIKEIYYGSRKIKEVYKGSKLIWSSSIVEPNYSGVVLDEMNSSPYWAKFGGDEEVDKILDMYGSIVIDETHKKYAYLDKTTHKKFRDGTNWDGSFGNAFRRFPKIYYKCYTEDGVQKLKISTSNLGGHYWDESFIGIYGSVTRNGKNYCTRSGTIRTGISVDNHISLIRSNGDDYGLAKYEHNQILVALHLCKFGCVDSSLTMGEGLVSQSGSFQYYTGACDDLGDGTGSMFDPNFNVQGVNQCTLFGIEGLAGNCGEIRDGISFRETTATTDKGRSILGIATGNSMRTIKKMILGEYFDILPKEMSIDSSYESGWYDAAMIYTNSKAEKTYVLTNGAKTYGKGSGLHTTIYVQTTGSTIGSSFMSRMAFYGDISQYQEVSGAELVALNS